MSLTRVAAAMLLAAPFAALADVEEYQTYQSPADAPHTAAPVVTTTTTTTTAARPVAVVPEVKKTEPKTWSDTARFFGGVRTGVGVPPGGVGVAPTAGFEVGVAADSGIGFGLHFTSVWNPPDAPSLNIPKAQWGIGAAADMRWYFQTVRPLTLYPTLSVGFLAGPTVQGRNAVLPMLNPGFGARIRLGNVYGSFEFGVMGFQVPFVSLAFGWEPNREQTDKL